MYKRQDRYQDPYLPGHGDRRYAVRHYDLALDVSVAGNHLSAIAKLSIEAREELDTITLDLRGLTVRRVLVDGKPSRKWRHSAGRLIVGLGPKVKAGGAVTIEVGYSGNPRPVPGIHGAAGWEELTDGVTVASQPQGAPSWYPCNDYPGDKATYRIRVGADQAYRVISNGVLTSTSRRSSRVVWTWEQREPMATYLATLQIGRYAVLPLPAPARVNGGGGNGGGNGGSNGKVPVLEVLYPSRKKAPTLKAFARQTEMVEVFTRLFGPYPYPAYRAVITDDVLEIPLEAQTLTIFGTNHLNPGWENERLIAHELAHQWFGNSLTATRWQDIWLHEGFACYSEWLWSEHTGRASAGRQARTHWDKVNKLPKDLVLGDPGPLLMFDDRIYKRGALTLHALRVKLGDKVFFEMLRAWTKARAHKGVDTPRFIAHAEGFAGRSLAAFFDRWLWRKSLPDLPN